MTPLGPLAFGAGAEPPSGRGNDRGAPTQGVSARRPTFLRVIVWGTEMGTPTVPGQGKPTRPRASDAGPRAGVRLLLPASLILFAGCSRQPAATPTPSDLLEVVTVTPGPERRPSPAVPAAATYVVQEGDTLSAIAERFDVSAAAILEANDLDDPNRVMVGEELVIPPREP